MSDIILVHLDALKSTDIITIVQYSMMGVVDDDVVTSTVSCDGINSDESSSTLNRERV